MENSKDKDKYIVQRIRLEDIEKIDKNFDGKSRLERIHQLVMEHEKAIPYLKSSEPESLKEILNSYSNCKCTSCYRYITVGEKFLWGRDHKGNSIRLCIDCQINSETDKSIVGKLIKKKRLERDIKALKNEKNRILSQDNELYVLKKLMEFLSKDKTLEKDEKKEIKEMVRDLIDLNKSKIIKSRKTAPKLTLKPQKEKSYDFAKEIFKILRDEKGFILTPSKMMKLLQEIEILGRNEQGGLTVSFDSRNRKDGLTEKTIIKFFDAYKRLDPQLIIHSSYH